MVAVLNSGGFSDLLDPLALQTDEIHPQDRVVIVGCQLCGGVLDEQLDKLVDVDSRLFDHFPRNTCHVMASSGKSCDGATHRFSIPILDPVKRPVKALEFNRFARPLRVDKNERALPMLFRLSSMRGACAIRRRGLCWGGCQ